MDQQFLRIAKDYEAESTCASFYGPITEFKVGRGVEIGAKNKIIALLQHARATEH